MAIAKAYPGVDRQGLEELARRLGVQVGQQGNYTVLLLSKSRATSAAAHCACGGYCGRFCDTKRER